MEVIPQCSIQQIRGFTSTRRNGFSLAALKNFLIIYSITFLRSLKACSLGKARSSAKMLLKRLKDETYKSMRFKKRTGKCQLTLKNKPSALALIACR